MSIKKPIDNCIFYVYKPLFPSTDLYTEKGLVYAKVKKGSRARYVEIGKLEIFPKSYAYKISKSNDSTTIVAVFNK